MKKLLYIILLLPLFAVSQTTNFSFTTLPFSSADILAPGRGLNTWNAGGGNLADWPFSMSLYGQGLSLTTMTYGYDAYIRPNWAQLEAAGSGTSPATSNRYDWSFIENNLKWCIDRGIKLSVGILNMAEGYPAFGTPGGANLSYPTYIHNQMQALAANDRDYISTTNDWVPNWNSSAYLNAHNTLLDTLSKFIASKSYTPSTGPKAGQLVYYRDVVNRIDIRGYGNFGEWHLAGLSSGPGNQNATEATLKAIVNQHKNNFPNYQLVMIMNALDQPSSFGQWILNNNGEAQNNYGPYGIRRDNAGQAIFNLTLQCNDNAGVQALIDQVYKKAPKDGEPSNYADGVSYKPGAPFVSAWCGPCDLGSKNNSFCTYSGSGEVLYGDYPNQVREQHITSIGHNNYGGSYNTNSPGGKDSIIAAAKYMGYRLVLNAGSMSTTLIQNSNFNVTLNWKNVGLTPVYENWNTIYELRNAADAVVQSWTLPFKVRNFLPAASDSIVSSNLALGNITPGTTYKLVLIIKDSLNYRKPLPLALSAPQQSADGSYLLRNNITVQASTARHQLTMSKERVYKRGGLPNQVLAVNWVDGDTLTAICSGYAQPVISKPNHIWYELPGDSIYNDLIFQIYNGAASPGTLSFTLFNKDLSDSVNVSKNMVTNSWNWIDTPSTKAFVPYIKWIRYNWGNECADQTTEMRVYAVNKDTATWKITPAAAPITPWNEFLGTSIEGTEDDTALIGGWDRSFQHRWYRDSSATLNTSARTMVVSVFDDGISKLNSYRAAGRKHLFTFESSIRALQTPVPSNPTNYGSFDVNKKNTIPGIDSTLPAAHLASAQEAYIIAAWGGRNNSVSIGPHLLKTTGNVNATLHNNVVDVFEASPNEGNMWNEERYHNAEVRAVRISAEADGHMGALGPYTGAKVADPTMKIYSGAAVGPDTVELKSDAFYTWKLRGRNNDPRDGIVINHYLTNGGPQGGGTNGISPGQFNLWDRAKDFTSVRDRYFPGRRIGIGEGLGYDKRQNTPFSALAHGSIDSLIAPANYATQAMHIYRASGVNFVFTYKSIDNVDLSTPGVYPQQSMGLSGPYNANPSLSHLKWPIWYWLNTAYTLCKKYNSKLPEIITKGDSTGLAHIKYDSSYADGTDTITHVYWMATNNDSYQSVTLNVGASIAWAEKVTMAQADKDGLHTALSPSGTNLNVGSVGEIPVYVRYVLGTAPASPYIRLGRKFKGVKIIN